MILREERSCQCVVEHKRSMAFVVLVMTYRSGEFAKGKSIATISCTDKDQQGDKRKSTA